MKNFYSLTILLLVSSAWLWAASPYDKELKRYQSEIKSTQSEVKELQQKIKAKESEKSLYQKQEQDIRKDLKTLESKYRQTERELDKMDEDIKQAERERKVAERQLFLTRLAYDQSQGALAMGLRHYYKRYYSVNNDFSQRLAAVYDQASVKNVGEEMAQTEADKRQAQASRARWEKSQWKLESLKGKIKRQKEAHRLARLEKDKIYQQARNKRQQAEEDIRQLRDTSHALQSLMKRLENQKQETLEAKRATELAKRALIKKKGDLPWPVSGSVVSHFGRHKHPELNTVVINNGIRIQCGRGSPVRSVDKGRVVFAGEFKAYGQMVVVDHNNGFHSIYGQLNHISVAQNQVLKTYEKIGAASDIVYFEFRQANEPQDPMAWLGAKHYLTAQGE